MRILVATIKSSRLDVVLAGEQVRRAGQRHDQKAPCDVQMLEEATVDLHLGDRADPGADAEGRNVGHVAFDSSGRVRLVLVELHAALNQHSTGANGLGVFGDERPLLRAAERRKGKTDSEHERGTWSMVHEVHQRRRLSSRIVTGPSFVRSTCICA